MVYILLIFGVLSVYIAPIVIPALWIAVGVIARKRHKLPAEDAEQREKLGRRLKKYLRTAIVLTVCMAALVIWFSFAMSHM